MEDNKEKGMHGTIKVSPTHDHDDQQMAGKQGSSNFSHNFENTCFFSVLILMNLDEIPSKFLRIAWGPWALLL